MSYGMAFGKESCDTNYCFTWYDTSKDLQTAQALCDSKSETLLEIKNNDILSSFLNWGKYEIMGQKYWLNAVPCEDGINYCWKSDRTIVMDFDLFSTKINLFPNASPLVLKCDSLYSCSVIGVTDGYFKCVCYKNNPSAIPDLTKPTTAITTTTSITPKDASSLKNPGFTFDEPTISTSSLSSLSTLSSPPTSPLPLSSPSSVGLGVGLFFAFLIVIVIIVLIVLLLLKKRDKLNCLKSKPPVQTNSFTLPSSSPTLNYASVVKQQQQFGNNNNIDNSDKLNYAHLNFNNNNNNNNNIKNYDRGNYETLRKINENFASNVYDNNTDSTNDII